jgi:hypothetical protein
MEAKMFENPHTTYMISKLKHEELLAEMEMRRKMESYSDIVPPGNRRFENLMQAIADLLIAIGVGLKRRFGPVPGGFEDGAGKGAEPDTGT